MSTLAPCGTKAARNRHKRNGETCEACTTHREIAPCGTKAARNRHRRNQETCEACKPVPKPAPPCGTYQAYRKGCRCEPCRATNRVRVRANARKKGVKPLVLAPCGTRAAKQRHRNNGESCDVCAMTGGRVIHECGTWQSRRRHARNNETCTVCDASKPVTKEPRAPREPKTPQPCGTAAAVKRHRYNNEPVCDLCRQADRERGETARREKGIPERITIEDLIQEIRFLINAGEGEHRILQATGYVGRGHSLRTRLGKAGQHQLANQIFGYELAA